jgi:putative molybdopterin biosynthesis protein
MARKGGAVASIEALVKARRRFAVREEGCSTRALAEELFAKAGRPLSAYRQVTGPYLTHREAARAVADGAADVALGIKGAATGFGLSFTRLVDEEFGLLMPSAFLAQPKVLGFVDALRSCIARAPRALLDGYDISASGTVSAFAVPAAQRKGAS